MKKIGYLGPRGTFTEEAARKYCAGKQVDMVCCQSLTEIVAAVEGGVLDEGVVPLENSTEGAVGEVLDLVVRSSGIHFCGEVIINIRHNLLARPGVDKSMIRRVISHPQAIAQCREFLARELPESVAGDTASTAQAAGIVAASPDPWAAIGSDLAAADCGLEVLAAGIQDSSENATRFIVLGRNDAGYSVCSRTSLVVAVKDRPGALYGILREFALREINLTRIESRPVKKELGRYMFFIDLEGHRSENNVKGAIEAVAGKAASLRVLGSYPRDTSAQVPVNAGTIQNIATLGEIRSEIDLVDQQIVELIGIRTCLAEKAGRFKSGADSVRDPVREDEVVRRVREIAVQKGADPEMIDFIYRHMISRSVEMQKEALKCIRPPRAEIH